MCRDLIEITFEHTFLYRYCERIPAARLFLVTTEHEHIFERFEFIQAKFVQGGSLFLLPSICTFDVGLFSLKFLS